MLSIILGILLFCLAVWLFFVLVESGFLLILVNAASFLFGLGILAFATPGLLTTILGLAFLVLPCWLVEEFYPYN